MIEPAQASHLGSRIQKNLHLGIGKNHCANIAALHHDPPIGSKLLLQLDHPGTNGGTYAHPGGCVRDNLIAELASDVFSVEQNTVFRFARFETDRGF